MANVTQRMLLQRPPRPVALSPRLAIANHFRIRYNLVMQHVEPMAQFILRIVSRVLK